MVVVLSCVGKTQLFQHTALKKDQRETWNWRDFRDSDNSRNGNVKIWNSRDDFNNAPLALLLDYFIFSNLGYGSVSLQELTVTLCWTVPVITLNFCIVIYSRFKCISTLPALQDTNREYWTEIDLGSTLNSLPPREPAPSQSRSLMPRGWGSWGGDGTNPRPTQPIRRSIPYIYGVKKKCLF